jgi:hypothetical protein
MQRSLEGVRASLEENRAEGRREFQMIQSNVRRVVIQPVFGRAAALDRVAIYGGSRKYPGIDTRRLSRACRYLQYVLLVFVYTHYVYFEVVWVMSKTF